MIHIPISDLGDLGVGLAWVGEKENRESAALLPGQGVVLQTPVEIGVLFLGESNDSGFAQQTSPGAVRGQSKAWPM
jgi:hypothetical protein